MGRRFESCRGSLGWWVGFRHFGPATPGWCPPVPSALILFFTTPHVDRRDEPLDATNKHKQRPRCAVTPDTWRYFCFPPARMPRIDGEQPRLIETTVEIEADGLSPILKFEVPADTRSITVVAEGSPDDLYALGSLRLADGVELVDELEQAPTEDMLAQYFQEEIGLFPGELHQTMRLGTYTHMYPHAPGQTAVAGPASLRLASTAPESTVKLSIVMPPDDGSRDLHLNFIAASKLGAPPDPTAYMGDAREILATAGINLIVDEVVVLDDSRLFDVTTFTEPQETPDGDAADLARAANEATDNASTKPHLGGFAATSCRWLQSWRSRPTAAEQLLQRRVAGTRDPQSGPRLCHRT